MQKLPKRSFDVTLFGKLFAGIFLLTLAAFHAPAQDNTTDADPVWVSGQAARLVIGQPYPTRQSPASSREIIGGAAGVAVGGNKLFIAEGNRIGAAPINNRVLVYDNLSSFVPAPDAEFAQGATCPACGGVADLVLGQPDFNTFTPGITDGGMQAPSGIATDGVRLAVADTNNNRIQLWLSLPTRNDQPPDVILGNEDGKAETSRGGLRGPQGVWLADGKLFVADTQNSRILIWNSIPSQSGAEPDVVIGQPDFDTRPDPQRLDIDLIPSASLTLDPTAVTVTDGKMFVTDLGFNRVLIFFSIPTSNAAPADVVIGQPDFEGRATNNSAALCEALKPGEDDGTVTPDDSFFPPPIVRDDGSDGDDDADVVERFPKRCEKTLNFPRFAISDGERLFVADSGNDRILIYDPIPTGNAAAADVVIGQANFIALVDSLDPGHVRAPTSLALDGDNLYVADPFTRRVLVFSPGTDLIALDGLRNGASFAVHASGSVEWNDSTQEEQTAEVTISGIKYETTTKANDTAETMRDFFMNAINSDEGSLVVAAPFSGLGVFAGGTIKFGGSVRGGETVQLQIRDRVYETLMQAGDEPFQVIDRFLFQFANEGEDPEVLVERAPTEVDTMLLTARTVGTGGNEINFSFTAPADSAITAEASGPTLSGGSTPQSIRLTAVKDGRPGNAVTVAALMGGTGITVQISGSRLTGGSNAAFLPLGSIAVLFGEGFSDGSFFPDPGATELPKELGGVRVYCNGIQTPLFSVTPTQINFQIPFEIEGTGLMTYIRRRLDDGRVIWSVPRSAEAPRIAPGLFAQPGPEPRQAVAVHAAGPATGMVAILPPSGNVNDGTEPDIQPGATITITVRDRNHTYTTQQGDTIDSVRDSLIEAINNANDPEVTARAQTMGFFSARADVEFIGDPTPGDVINIIVRDRTYTYTALEGDTATIVRNILVQRINEGRGDLEVTARRLQLVFQVVLQVIARELGTSGNDIPFAVSTNDGAAIVVTNSVEEDGLLQGGQTPPIVELVAREPGRQGNEINYDASSSDEAIIIATARGEFLCCGNVAFSLITEENPAIPGEDIVVFGSGLGLTSPTPAELGFVSGQPTPLEPLANVPFNALDFVSSLVGGRTAQVQFAGLMPGFVGVYQINLRLNDGLPDDPLTPLTIAQVLFISNTVTIPIENLRPRAPDDDGL